MTTINFEKPIDFDTTEPDYDAVKLMAGTWFALTVRDFFNLPRERMEEIARMAGVTPERWPGFCKAVITMAHTPKNCPRAN